MILSRLPNRVKDKNGNGINPTIKSLNNDINKALNHNMVLQLELNVEKIRHNETIKGKTELQLEIGRLKRKINNLENEKRK